VFNAATGRNDILDVRGVTTTLGSRFKNLTDPEISRSNSLEFPFKPAYVSACFDTPPEQQS
jgi:hypothetical protein